jgi:hypothetical protein
VPNFQYRIDMHCTNMSLAMATLVLGLLAAPSPTAVAVETSGRDCSAGCGYYDIRYPFGIGPECSLPGFNLSCVAGAHNTSNLLLGSPSIEVSDFHMPWKWFNFSFPTVHTSIGYFAKLAPAQNYSVHWEAPDPSTSLGRLICLPSLEAFGWQNLS